MKMKCPNCKTNLVNGKCLFCADSTDVSKFIELCNKFHKNVIWGLQQEEIPENLHDEFNQLADSLNHEQKRLVKNGADSAYIVMLFDNTKLDVIK